MGWSEDILEKCLKKQNILVIQLKKQTKKQKRRLGWLILMLKEASVQERINVLGFLYKEL